MTKFLAVGLLLFGQSVSALTIEFAFEPTVSTGEAISGGIEGFQTEGFQFTFTPDPAPLPPHFFAGGDFVAICPGCGMSMTRIDGALFDLTALDAWQWRGDPANLIVTGYRQDGTSIQITTDFPSATPLNLPPEWVDLQRVEFDLDDEDSSPVFNSISVEFVPAAPALACRGFAPPLASGVVKVKGSKRSKVKRRLPLKARLVDEGQQPVDDLGLIAPPELVVLFEGGEGVEDVSDKARAAGIGTRDHQFEFVGSHWRYNLKTKNYNTPGNYTITMKSGDSTEYVIEPACAAEFVIK